MHRPAGDAESSERADARQGPAHGLSNDRWMMRVLAPYGPRKPLEVLVEEVNRIYHSFEAHDYDRAHPEITRQLPPIWREMVGVAVGRTPRAGWRILDFGCGTGFEAEQLIRNLPSGSIETLVCYDPSPEMLERCRRRIGTLFPGAIFTTELGNVSVEQGQPLNLLATNSLLHHLHDPLGTIEGLVPALDPDALWLAGHEPSSRYYMNQECLRVYEEFSRRHSVVKYLSPAKYAERLAAALGRGRDPAGRTASAAQAQGLFERVPSRPAIVRLVDFHVAHSPDEAGRGRGLDVEQMKRELAGKWDLLWVRSYAFMGPHYEGGLSPRWVRKAEDLSKRHPLDGANFSSVWVRRR